MLASILVTFIVSCSTVAASPLALERPAQITRYISPVTKEPDQRCFKTILFHCHSKTSQSSLSVRGLAGH